MTGINNLENRISLESIYITIAFGEAMNTTLPILRSVADLTTASWQTNKSKNMGNPMTAIYIVSVDRLRLEDFFAYINLYFRL